MSFLASIVVQIVEWLLEKLFSFFKKKADQAEKSHEIDKQADADKKEIQNADTDDDKVKAIDHSINDTFG